MIETYLVSMNRTTQPSPGLGSVFDLNSSMMSATNANVTFLGWAIVFPNIVSNLLPILIMLLVLMVLNLIVSVFNGYKKKTRGNERELSEEKKTPKTKLDIFLECSLAMMLFLTLFLGSFYWAYEKGKSRGGKIMDYYENKDGGEGTEILVFIRGTQTRGVFIGCGAENCAAIERGTRRIFYFPQSLGYSFLLSDEGHADSSKHENKQDRSELDNEGVKTDNIDEKS